MSNPETTAPSEIEIDAGARALASRFFLDSRRQETLEWFPPAQQQGFRDKAAAVLEAAAKVRPRRDR